MRKLALLTIAAAGLTVSSQALAAVPACDSLGGPPVIYIENGDTQEPMLKALGAALIKSASPLRIVYRNRPTCSIRIDMYSKATVQVAADGATARPWKYIHDVPTEATTECSVPATGSGTVPIALGIGATYLSSCKDAITDDGTLAVLDGPVQAYGFITNTGSSQNGIRAEEGYLAFGFTEGLGDAQPWIVGNLRFKRSATASTSLTMASAIGMKSPTEMVGAITAPAGDTSANIILAVNGASQPEAALGIIGADLYDVDRTQVKFLPFRAFNQRFAYYPDKTSDTFDKQNVRDGHYVPWAPTPYMSPKSSTDPTKFADANAERVYELVRGFKTETDVNGLAIIASNSLIPQCAMSVTRSGDGADLSLAPDPAPCGCFYEKNVKNGSTSCATCSDDTTCGGGKCRLGFCEAR